MDNTCDHCNKAFPTSKRGKVYCSTKCKNALLYLRHKAIGIKVMPRKNRSMRKTGMVRFPSVEERNRRVVDIYAVAQAVCGVP